MSIKIDNDEGIVKLQCLNCGITHRLQGFPDDQLRDIIADFFEDHRNCKEKKNEEVLDS